MNEKKKDKEREGLFLGMVEEEVYYRCVGELSRRWGHLRESRVEMDIALSGNGHSPEPCEQSGKGRERRKREPGTAARIPKEE